MNDSKLNMSKLAVESGNKSERSNPGERDNNKEKLDFSRLEGNVSGPDSKETTSRNDDDRLYQEALKYYAEAYAAVRQEKSFSVDPAMALVKKISGSLKGSNTLFLRTIHQDYQKDTVIHHSVNVAILSIMIGNNLGISGSGLVQLGSAALLHDIGTARVSDELFHKPSALTFDELKKVRQRTVLSHQILSQVGGKYGYLSEIAVQVYERLDGSGYPSGLKDDDIHEYARIIGLADFYEALIHSRPHRDRFLHFPAIKEILRSGKQSFDKRHLKALVNVVSLFPVFSYVRLNSGAVGRVLETHTQNPLSPKLKIIIDAQKRPVTTERIISLRENALLHITDAVAEEAVNSTFV